MDLENEKTEEYGQKLLQGFDANLQKAREVLFGHRDYSILHVNQQLFDADVASPILQAVGSKPSQRRKISDADQPDNKKQKTDNVKALSTSQVENIPILEPDIPSKVSQIQASTTKDRSYQASIADSALGSSIVASTQQSGGLEDDDWSDDEDFAEYLSQKK